MSWSPSGAHVQYGPPPDVGTLIAFRFRAWRIAEVRERGDKFRVYLRPPEPQFDLAEHNYPVTAPARCRWDILPEHYGVCVKCGDLQPCREVFAERQGKSAMAEFDRYDRPGVCPACEEVVTHRQKSVTLQNVISPVGPLVIFHRRGRCLSSAITYERRVIAATGGKATLSCAGTLIGHTDGSRECLDLECPGTDVSHGTYMACYYRSHGCPRLECQL